jgi:inhibitor of KinA
VATLHCTPLSDQAVLIYCPDEAAALEFTAAVRAAAPVWLIDVVQAYTSVAIFFDLAQTRYAFVVEELMDLEPAAPARATLASAAGSVVIPCCYELGPDLQRVAEQTKLSAAEVIRLHTEATYTVYAIGFCPGFPYLGYLPAALAGVARLPAPRLRVEVGSVGLTGRQTGIYTEERPGGWNLIGRTPLELVSVRDGYFPLRTGDQVRFQRIDEAEFVRLRAQRLKR